MSLASLTSALSSLLEQNILTPSESVHRPAPSSAASQCSFYLLLSAPSAPQRPHCQGPGNIWLRGFQGCPTNHSPPFPSTCSPWQWLQDPGRARRPGRPTTMWLGRQDPPPIAGTQAPGLLSLMSPLISTAKLAEKEQKEMLSKYSELTLTRNQFFTLNLWEVFHSR